MSKILATNSFLIRSRETVIRYLTRRQKRKSSYTARYRSIFIIPTLAGIGCATLLMAMLILATNFGNNMVFALDFMLGSLWFVALYGTHHNLLHLRLEALPCMPVFSGDNARFKIRITNPTRTTRYGIRWLSQNHGGILANPIPRLVTRAALFDPNDLPVRLVPRLELDRTGYHVPGLSGSGFHPQYRAAWTKPG